MEGLVVSIITLLDEIQESIYNKAKTFREEYITKAETWDEFVRLLDEKRASFPHIGTEQEKLKIK
jgi:prolyl-tRNA synthetase